MPCHYVPELTAETREVVISGEEYHHIAHVMRHGVGDVLLLTNGAGVMADAIIERMDKRGLTARITAVRSFQKSRPLLACAFSLLRSKHDHLIVEKLTELGASAFFPFVCERSVRLQGGNTADKFAAVAVAALKQCDGAFLPTVQAPQSLEAAIAAVQAAGYTPLMASEAEHALMLPAALTQHTGDLCLVIGPEGGWSDAERAWFAAQGLPQVSLGNHVVRAETAAIAGMSMMLGKQLIKNQSYY